MLQIWACPTAKKAQEGRFQKVAECLYQYSRNGVYYARIKRGGKETSARSERLIGLWRSGSSEISEISSGKSALTGQPDSGLSCATAGWQQSRTPSRKRSSKRPRLLSRSKPAGPAVLLSACVMSFPRRRTCFWLSLGLAPPVRMPL